MKHETAPSVRQQVSAAEWDVRVNLAAAYRLVALYGWDDLHSHPAPGGHGRVDAIGAVRRVDREGLLDAPALLGVALVPDARAAAGT